MREKKVTDRKFKKKCYIKEAIKSWPEEDRPREKLIKHGSHLLTDTELLAILLRTGVKGKSAVDLARKILQKFKTFQNMSHTDIRDWKEFKGLGKAKISALKAALEIARRFNVTTDNTTKTTIKFSEDIVRLFKARMQNLKNEIFKVVLLNGKNCIIDSVEITKGTPVGTNPIIREVISKALQKYSSGIICMHNHPSGDPVPSREDEIFTKDLKEAVKLMDIKFHDHIIFGENEFYSFDKGTKQKYQ